MNTETFSLSKPIKTHNGEVQTLTLKEPTARSFMDHGEPFTLKPRYNTAGEQDGVTFEYTNNKALMGFLCDMIEPKVDDLLLSSISASDFQRLRGVATHIILAGVPDKNPTEPSGA